jgi:capsular polysaccharide biosynthesis protein
VDLGDYLRAFGKHWLVLLVFVAVGLIGGFIVTAVSANVYSATAQVVVSVEVPQKTTIAQLTAANLLSEEKALDYVAIVPTSRVLDEVARKVDFRTTSAELEKQVSATTPFDTNVVVITATSSSAERSASIANSTIDALRDLVDTTQKPRGGAGLGPIRLTVAQRAISPSAPVSPRPALNIALGLILGLALGLVTALFMAGSARRGSPDTDNDR